MVAEIDGYPATFHVRDFLDCVKTRSQPKGNADAACFSHIACHAANIALALNRKLNYDLKKHEFVTTSKPIGCVPKHSQALADLTQS